MPQTKQHNAQANAQICGRPHLGRTARIGPEAFASLRLKDSPMHRHTVLFNLKDELSEAEKKRVIDSMQTLRTISTVKGYMLEKNKLPAGDKAPYEWLLVADFANDDDRQTYEKDAHHVKVIKGDFVPAVKNYIISDVNF
ncbi:MAG: Dabb family protein [Alphaproteobacteria bacterium]|nr:Dabb family protein [Alphaproteobacteria bacterium]PHY01164.1 MAG: hypothetical protein CK529_03620 [Rhodospirillaceae bacterium]